MTNTGSSDDTFSLAVTGLPSGVTATLRRDVHRRAAGVSNFRDVGLTLTSAAGTAAGTYPFTVTATSTSDSSVSATTTGTLTVSAAGVKVSLGPGSAAPGSSFLATVTNTGTTSDTFKLALAGPAALVASPGVEPGDARPWGVTDRSRQHECGGFRRCGITATGRRGDLREQSRSPSGLTGKPEHSHQRGDDRQLHSRIADAVEAGHGDIHADGTEHREYPGFLLSDDCGLERPRGGDLVGLSGSNTQAVPTFVLPGFSHRSHRAQAELSAIGKATVTVEVQSLSDPAITMMAVATVMRRQPLRRRQPMVRKSRKSCATVIT